jgi:hypothetical protein
MSEEIIFLTQIEQNEFHVIHLGLRPPTVIRFLFGIIIYVWVRLKK